jgi:hypothetical protein
MSGLQHVTEVSKLPPRSRVGLVRVGLHGALLARGLDPFGAACLAGHAQGRGGDRGGDRARVTLGENGMVASDLVDAIAQELR